MQKETFAFGTDAVLQIKNQVSFNQCSGVKFRNVFGEGSHTATL